jgi:hypothetical protein
MSNDASQHGRAPARDNNGHIHPPGHFCGSNCPMYRPKKKALASFEDLDRELRRFSDAD